SPRWPRRSPLADSSLPAEGRLAEGRLAERRLQVQQLLVETADLPPQVDEVDLEDPVADLPVGVMPAHRAIAAGIDVALDPRAVDLLLRELPAQVPGDRPAEIPAGRAGQIGHVGVQLRAGD